MKYEKSQVEKVALSARPRDLVCMKTVWSEGLSRYLVIKVNRKIKSIDLLPLEEFYKEKHKQEAPVLSVPFDIIETMYRIDKGDLLFLANQGNPHIVSALESL